MAYVVNPTLSKFSQNRHQKFHHPVINGKAVSSTPYLTLPFTKKDLIKAAQQSNNPRFNKSKLYYVSEGWVYSLKEQRVHHQKIHAGVDFYVPYSTEVVAPCDGYAISSYHTLWIRDEEAKIKLFQGQKVRIGLGYFVQIYNPSVQRFVQIAHLSDIASTIPFSVPQYNKKDDSWIPTNHTLKVDELQSNPNVVYLKRGDTIGFSGVSGLALGEVIEYYEGLSRPLVLNPETFKSWDEPHVHLEEFWRDTQTNRKGWQRDPYDIYLTWNHYPTHTKKRPMGKEPLWILDNKGFPLFADLVESCGLEPQTFSV